MSEKSTEISPVVKSQITKAVAAAQELEIKVPEDLGKATDLRAKIKKVGKLITDEKKKITGPLSDALDAARAFFVPFENQYKEAEKIVNVKMLDYEKKIDEENRKQEEKITAKVEQGKMSLEKAAEKMEAVVPVAKTVEGKTGKATFKIVHKYEVVDKSKLPIEFLQPDTGAIWKAVQGGAKEIPGCRIWDEKTIA